MIVTAGAAAALFAVATALLDEGDHVLIAEPELRHEPRDAASDRCRGRARRAAVRGRLGARPRPARGGATPGDEAGQPHLSAQPDRGDDRPGDARARWSRSSRPTAVRGCSSTRPTASSPTTSHCRWPPGSRERAISVSSMSKTYGLPGLRIGWIACRDPELAETLLAAKEQILICGSTIDEEMAARVLEARGPDPAADPGEDRARTSGSSASGWPRQDVFEWVEPKAGVVGMPRFRAESRSTSTASTRTCSPTTAPTSAPATGSIRTGAQLPARLRLAGDG